MKVIRAAVLGFCMGVRRAVSVAVDEAKKARCARVCTLGPLVHNPVVLDELKELGVGILAEPFGDLKDAAVIIRAHGISPAKEKELRNKGASVIDATCPKVKQLQVTAQKLAKECFGIFIAGEKNHAEIEGILGYARDAPFYKVIGSAEEAEEIIESFYKLLSCSAFRNIDTALLGQTTISGEEYYKIAGVIKKHFPNLKVIDTICSATVERQDALRELLGKVGAVIVAGGRESANTKRLLAIAEESGKPCCLVESAAEVPSSFFNYGIVGISAGASTPDCVVDGIEKYLTAN